MVKKTMTKKAKVDESEEVVEEVEAESEETPLERKAALEAELAEVEAEQARLVNLKKEIEADIDALTHYLTGNAAPHSNQIAIMEHIQSQNRLRAERHGIYIEPVPFRSPLDLAMMANRRRGTARPKIPLKG